MEFVILEASLGECTLYAEAAYSPEITVLSKGVVIVGILCLAFYLSQVLFTLDFSIVT